MATKMSFDELYRHLGEFISSPDIRWKYAMRACSVPSRVPQRVNGKTQYQANAKDQCYFAGSVEILRRAMQIDFKLLYSGKVALNDLSRVQRIARLNCIKYPEFMKNEEVYKSQLVEIALKNMVIEEPVINNPMTAIRQPKKPGSRQINHSNSTSNIARTGRAKNNNTNNNNNNGNRPSLTRSNSSANSRSLSMGPRQGTSFKFGSPPAHFFSCNNPP